MILFSSNIDHGAKTCYNKKVVGWWVEEVFMTNKPYDDSNWREEYKSYTSNQRHLDLLENGPKSLSQSWILGALYNE